MYCKFSLPLFIRNLSSSGFKLEEIFAERQSQIVYSHNVKSENIIYVWDLHSRLFYAFHFRIQTHPTHIKWSTQHTCSFLFQTFLSKVSGFFWSVSFKYRIHHSEQMFSVYSVQETTYVGKVSFCVQPSLLNITMSVFKGCIQ